MKRFSLNALCLTWLSLSFPLAAVAQSTPSASQIVTPQISLSERGAYYQQLLQLVKQPESVRQETLEQQLQALKSPDQQTRIDAVLALGILRDKRALFALSGQLKKDPVPAVRWLSAEALARLGDKRAVPVLVQALNDPHPSVRSFSAMALGALGEIQAVPALLRALHDPQLNVRTAVLLALGNLKDKRAVPDILVAATAPEEEMRSSALSAFIGFADDRAVAILIQALQEPNSKLRETAVLALMDQEASEILPALLPLLQDSERKVRELVVLSLANRADPRALPALYQARRSETDPKLQQEILSTIELLREP